MTDPLAALLALIGADNTVKQLAGTRVFGLELPRPETNFMPRKAVVVKPAGLGTAAEAGTYADLTTGRYDVWSYGDTPYEARQLQLATYAVLKALQRKVVAGVLLHSAERTGGPLPIRDPLTTWPISVETWELLSADVAIT